MCVVEKDSGLLEENPIKFNKIYYQIETFFIQNGPQII